MLVLCNFLRKLMVSNKKIHRALRTHTNYSYEQYPLEKFFIFTIYQNYTLALSIPWSRWIFFYKQHSSAPCQSYWCKNCKMKDYLYQFWGIYQCYVWDNWVGDILDLEFRYQLITFLLFYMILHWNGKSLYRRMTIMNIIYILTSCASYEMCRYHL